MEKRIKNYKILKEDFDKLIKGEEIEFYEGRDLKIFIRFEDSIIKGE